MFSIDEMHSLLCYFSFINKCQNTSKEVDLILYNNGNGIITLKKHVYVDHCMIAKLFEEKVNNLLKKLMKEKTS